jgi:ribosomal protein S18 acetylase RimI-like enzyme
MNPGEFQIEAATWRDLGPLRSIENECFGDDAWPLIDLLGVLTFPGIVRLKAVVGERMVGFIAGDGSRNKKMGWITTVGVIREFRQKGIGKALLLACEQQMPNQVIQLTVKKSNTPAILMYQKYGYEKIQEWEKYYNGGETGIVMRKVKT